MSQFCRRQTVRLELCMSRSQIEGCTADLVTQELLLWRYSRRWRPVSGTVERFALLGRSGTLTGVCVGILLRVSNVPPQTGTVLY